MNNIVIVEDKLKRGISLAEQFNELGQSNPELDIHVTAVCYFNPSKEEAEKDIEACGSHDFDIVPVSLWNFDKVLDGYMDVRKEKATVIMDFILDNDGSEGIAIKRVNIRYARRASADKGRRIWFYTATGTANHNILCELFGEERVLEVINVGDDFLQLDLQEEKFMSALRGQTAGA